MEVLADAVEDGRREGVNSRHPLRHARGSEAIGLVGPRSREKGEEKRGWGGGGNRTAGRGLVHTYREEMKATSEIKATSETGRPTQVIHHVAFLPLQS